MDKFQNIKSIPAYLPIVNVDTDMIIPKQFLKTIKRTELGVSLFFEMRYDKQTQKPIKDFVLNVDPYTSSKILIGENNFGCGSSREHAPWALLDFGIKVIIAPSFADIFYNNCFKNSVLPIKLEKDEINQLFLLATPSPISIEIDLIAKELKVDEEISMQFEVKDSLLQRIIHNLDDVDITLKDAALIKAYEQSRQKDRPWLFNYSNPGIKK